MSPNDQFLLLLEEESEPRLERIGFSRTSIDLKGYATYEYSGIDSSVLLMYGPSDWHVEMVIAIGSNRYELKDLFQMPGEIKTKRHPQIQMLYKVRLPGASTFLNSPCG